MTTEFQHWQPLQRGDRCVQRARLRLPAGASQHRATFLIEESLRLMALPGEAQGRTYYFHRVALRGIPAAAPLGEWIEGTQATMQALARYAVHGSSPQASNADVVFFYSQQEALEWLLGGLLRKSSILSLTAAAWFAPMISNIAAGASSATQIVAVIERLRSLPARWFAVATAILALLEANSDVASLLVSLPDSTVRLWLSELGLTTAVKTAIPRISPRVRRILLAQIADYVGFDASSASPPAASRRLEMDFQTTRMANLAPEPSLQLLWLAAMAIIAEDPGVLASGTAIGCARAALKELSNSLAGPAKNDANAPREQSQNDSLPRSEQGKRPSKPPIDNEYANEELLSRKVTDQALDQAIDGSLATAAGGLYFLLNVLRLLDIAEAVDRLPPRFRGIFLGHLIASLAHAASVSDADPAVLSPWTGTLTEWNDDSQFSVTASLCWPRAFLQPPDTQHDVSRLVRVWTLAVRRWCWIMGRLRLCDIVCRPGRILLTRTDLDVTLSMNTVDLRLRRLGLDLDPGWLPWFGRVVRFHYTNSPLSESTPHQTGDAPA